MNDDSHSRFRLPTGLRGPCQSLVLLMIVLQAAPPILAQSAEVPRTRTFSGLVAPAFPYAKPEEVGLSSEKLDWIGDEITSWVAAGELVGAELLVVKDGKAVFHEAYGWSDRERRIPVERNSIWWVGGMSKPITATAVLMLVDEGRLALDDSVARFIPEFAGDERTTLRHLLMHTSGFGDGPESGRDEEDFAFLGEWISAWAAEGPTEPFGEFFNSDFNFAALGHIVGVVSGMPIDEFIEDRIIERLELADASAGFSPDPAWRARLNPWYRWNERAGQYDLRRGSDWPGWRYYSDGLFCTAMDYAEFLGMWLNGGAREGVRLLSEATVDEALTLQVRDDILYGYGYGWYIQQSPGAEGPPSNFHHRGMVGTQANAYPADNAMVIYFTHSRWGPHHDALYNRVGMSGLFGRYPGPDMVWAGERSFAEVALEPDERARYTGSYLAEGEVDPFFEVLRVREEGGLLQLRTGPSGVEATVGFHLVPLGEDRFALGRYADGRLQGVDPLWELRFVMEEDVAKGIEILEEDTILVSARRTE